MLRLIPRVSVQQEVTTAHLQADIAGHKITHTTAIATQGLAVILEITVYSSPATKVGTKCQFDVTNSQVIRHV